MSQIGLPPPPLSDIWDFFEFETYLKNADPPSRINLRHFWIWEHIDGGRTPQINILKGLFRHIYIEKGQIKCFNFSFLGWGLRVTYNWDIFEKLRPPPIGFQMSEFEFETFLVFFRSPPPPYLGHCPKFSCFLIMTHPLRISRNL